MNSGTAGWYSLIQWPSKISNVAGLKFTISKQEIYFLVLSWCSFQHAMLVYQSIQKITMTSKKKKEWRHKPLHIYTSDMLLFQCVLRGVWYIVIISSIDNTTFNPEFGMIWAISRTVLWRSLRWTMFVQTSSLRCQTFSMWEWPNFVESNDMMIRRLKKKNGTFSQQQTFPSNQWKHLLQLPKYNSSPLKSYQKPIGSRIKIFLPFPPFFRGVNSLWKTSGV